MEAPTNITYTHHQIIPYNSHNQDQISPYTPSQLSTIDLQRRNAIYANEGYGSFRNTAPKASIFQNSLSSSMRFTEKYSYQKEDPETKRRKRVASYKSLAMEGKLKLSIQRSFKWMKQKFEEVRYGIW